MAAVLRLRGGEMAAAWREQRDAPRRGDVEGSRHAGYAYAVNALTIVMIGTLLSSASRL